MKIDTDEVLRLIAEKVVDKDVSDFIYGVVIALGMSQYAKRKFRRAWPVGEKLFAGETLSRREIGLLFDAGVWTAYVIAKNVRTGAIDVERLMEKNDRVLKKFPSTTDKAAADERREGDRDSAGAGRGREGTAASNSSRGPSERTGL